MRRNLFWLAEGSELRHYDSGFPLLYGWDFYTSLKQVLNSNASTAVLAATHGRETQGLTEGRYRLRFITNHDFTFTEGPPVTLYRSVAAARAAFVATLAYGATPMLYNGQEVDDATRLNLFERSTINWNTRSTTPAFYRMLLAAYDSLPALRTGNVLSPALSPDVVTVLRTKGTRQVAVLVNMRNRTASVTLPGDWQSKPWVDVFTGQAVSPGASLSLPAYGYSLWKTR